VLVRVDRDRVHYPKRAHARGRLVQDHITTASSDNIVQQRRAVGLRDQHKQRTTMAASSKLMITEAERRFPCRIKVGVPIGGLGARLTEMQVWLDENCGADGWIMAPAGLPASSTMRSRRRRPLCRDGAPAQRSKSAMGHSECSQISRLSVFQPGPQDDVLSLRLLARLSSGRGCDIVEAG
jgi:hypothetical protein